MACKPKVKAGQQVTYLSEALAGKCEKRLQERNIIIARGFYMPTDKGEKDIDNSLLFLHTLLWRSFYLKVRGKIPGSYSIIGTSSMDVYRGHVVHIPVRPVCLPTLFERVHQY